MTVLEYDEVQVNAHGDMEVIGAWVRDDRTNRCYYVEAAALVR